jgi:hypothetical protein
VVQEASEVPRTGGGSSSRPPWLGKALIAAPLAVLLVAGIVVVVHIRQASRQRADIAEITAAFQRGDCPGASAALAAARSRTLLYGNRAAVPQAALDQVGQCGRLDQARVLGDGGKDDQAIAAYLDYLKDNEQSPLGRIVTDRMGRVLRDGEPPATSGLCRDLATVVAADQLAAHETFPELFTDCGVKLAASTRSADRKGARALLSEVRTTYPQAPQLERAGVAEAKARIALSPDGGTMTSPYRVSGAAKQASVRYVNHTPWAAVLAVSGAKDGRVVELGGCPTCELYEETSNGPRNCESNGAKAVTIELAPGKYRVAIQYVGDNAPPDNSGEWTLSKGRYAECYYGIK